MMKDVWEGKDFYDLMQAYRHTPIVDQHAVVENYETVKGYIREQIAALTERCKELEKWASEHGLIILDKKEFWGESEEKHP